VVTVLLAVKAFDERYLRAAVASVLGQTSPAWRLNVVTVRGQVAVLAELLARELGDPRVSLVASEGQGLPERLNTGMRKAGTDFVAILHGDDLWAPEAVDVLGRHVAASPEIDFFHSSRRYIDDDGNSISGIYRSRPSVQLEDFASSTPVKHLLCWRRELALSFGGMDESLELGPDDYDLPWSMAEHGARFASVPECLYVYRDHRQFYRLTTHVPLSVQTRDLAKILRKHGVDRPAIRRRVAEARRSYMQQALFASPLDRWVKQRTGADPRAGWREPYVS
jgi:hypothetical protein